MDRAHFERLTVTQLGDFLREKNVSDRAVTALAKDNISGLALLLVEETELNEMLPTIGDRAVIRNLLRVI